MPKIALIALIVGLLGLPGAGGQDGRLWTDDPIFDTPTLVDLSYTYVIPQPIVVSTTLVNGRLEIVYRQGPNPLHLVAGRVDDSVWKDVYVARAGAVVLDTTIAGRHIPAHTTEERIEFD